jgi:PAS domain S-box-containing protein
MPEPALDLFRLAFELSPVGIIVIDVHGTIVLANREVERLFGYGRDELVGRSIDILVPERFRARHPGFRDGFFKNPQARPMGAGRDLFGLRKDGSQIPVEIGLKPITGERASHDRWRQTRDCGPRFGVAGRGRGGRPREAARRREAGPAGTGGSETTVRVSVA